MELVYLGDPVLREICEKVDLNQEKDYINKLVDDMIKLTIESKGVGLAAPQVGISICLIVIKDMETGQFIEMINPEIVWKSFDREYDDEGCLSVLGDDNKPIHKKIWRYKRIKVKWQDKNGNFHEKLVTNPLQSRIIQHETDHLRGRLFIDYLENEE